MGGVQVTASHNPSEYIGMKFCKRDCVPISYETGIAELERLCAGDLPAADGPAGTISTQDVMEGYVQHVAGFVTEEIKVPCIIDAGNGMAGHTLPAILDHLNIQSENLYFELDGTFPNHEANPIKIENLQDVIDRVKATDAQVGLAFDGDADRCAFIDENGDHVPNDIMTAILAREILDANPGSHVVYDLRSSRVVAEEVISAGGTPVKERVGHSFIKATMRREDAAFGGELSGHYYFRENFTSDSGVIAMLMVMQILQRDGVKLSELAKPLMRYPATGEVNFIVEEKDAMIESLKETFSDGEISDLDGVTVTYPTFWFNVRKSNTEPLLRLNLEADDASTMDAALARLLPILGTPDDG